MANNKKYWPCRTIRQQPFANRPSTVAQTLAGVGRCGPTKLFLVSGYGLVILFLVSRCGPTKLLLVG